MANPLKMFGGGAKTGFSLMGKAAANDEQIGGIISGGVSGGTTGASLGGPVGAAVGMFAGSILGGVSGTKAQKARYAEEDEELEFQSLLAKGDEPFDPRQRTSLTSKGSQATLLG